MGNITRRSPRGRSHWGQILHYLLHVERIIGTERNAIRRRDSNALIVDMRTIDISAIGTMVLQVDLIAYLLNGSMLSADGSVFSTDNDSVLRVAPDSDGIHFCICVLRTVALTMPFYRIN